VNAVVGWRVALHAEEKASAVEAAARRNASIAIGECVQKAEVND
jgi:hypothetical protein